jgi:hypothetical protein
VSLNREGHAEHGWGFGYRLPSLGKRLIFWVEKGKRPLTSILQQECCALRWEVLPGYRSYRLVVRNADRRLVEAQLLRTNVLRFDSSSISRRLIGANGAHAVTAYEQSRDVLQTDGGEMPRDNVRGLYGRIHRSLSSGRAATGVTTTPSVLLGSVAPVDRNSA